MTEAPGPSVPTGPVAGGRHGEEKTTAGDLLGAWTLVCFLVEDIDTGALSEPFGPAPRGAMMFHPGGRMFALITPRDRLAPASDSERAASFARMVACSGPYRLEPPDRFVIAVDCAWFEPWVGSEQVRTYRVEGDRLEIRSAPTRLPGENGTEASVVAVLSWLREGPVSAA